MVLTARSAGFTRSSYPFSGSPYSPSQQIRRLTCAPSEAGHPCSFEHFARLRRGPHTPMTAVMQKRRPVTTAGIPKTAASPPPPPSRAHPSAVLALITAGAAATVALWFHDTTSIHGWGEWLTNAGRVPGLLAGYGVVVLVA